MAADPTAKVVALRPPIRVREAVASPALDGAAGTSALRSKVDRRFGVVLPAINVASIGVVYVFIQFVVPLPHGCKPTGLGALLETAVGTAIGWITCRALGRKRFRPVSSWLERGGAPSESERMRAVRFPLNEAAYVLGLWTVAGIAFAAVDLILGGGIAPAVLVAAILMLGGTMAGALCYLATESIMRPVIALALSHDPPVRPLMPGIAARIYLAWEFGTAMAVWGVVVVAVAYLCGAAISPNRLAVTVIFLGGLALVVGLGTLLTATKSVADPLRGLRRAMARLEAGDTDVDVPIDDGSEVGLLQAGFNKMVDGLHERDRVRDLFGRHVGEEVAASAIGRGVELGGELREAAVLFVDVIGSTAFAATSNPDEVVATLNRFFGVVVEVVTLHGGWVNKFEGDAALCAFGAPTDHPDAAGAALAAARALRLRLMTELDGLDAAIGLSAGPIVAGNIGAARRYEYTVVGDPVNEAARLTELAKLRTSRLLASEAIVERAGATEAARWKLEDVVMLRGRTAPTQIAAPVSGARG